MLWNLITWAIATRPAALYQLSGVLESDQDAEEDFFMKGLEMVGGQYWSCEESYLAYEIIPMGKKCQECHLCMAQYQQCVGVDFVPQRTGRYRRILKGCDSNSPFHSKDTAVSR